MVARELRGRARIAWACANCVGVRVLRGRAQIAWTRDRTGDRRRANRVDARELRGHGTGRGTGGRGGGKTCADERGAPTREVRRQERCADKRGAPTREVHRQEEERKRG